VLETRILDLNALVAGLESPLSQLVGEDVKLVFQPGEGLGRIRADPTQLEQVLTSLAANARDSMPNGGQLVLETTNADMDAGWARAHPGAVAGRYVCLIVSDTGKGIPLEVQSRIFEPFFTTKEPGRGTGLGLSEVYGIVRQSDGFIHADSAPGRGTTFWIYLPRVDPVIRGTETVLLVEDELHLKGRLSALLEEEGFRVLVAESPSAALDLAERHPGPIALLLADLAMPSLQGRELAPKVRAQRPGIRVLFMSGHPEAFAAGQTEMEEGSLLVSEPFSQKGLVQRIRQLLDSPGPG
jgi:CheY-like chemotaxis protein